MTPSQDAIDFVVMLAGLALFIIAVGGALAVALMIDDHCASKKASGGTSRRGQGGDDAS